MNWPHTILILNNSYSPKQYGPADLCNGDALCFPCCGNWIFYLFLDYFGAAKI